MIGILDSGVGGLSIYLDITSSFPGAEVRYFSDNANFPYGEKSKEQLSSLVTNRVSCLVNMGAKVVVLACNSATVAAITDIRKQFNVPIIGIEPGIKVAVNVSKNKNIGLMATNQTVENYIQSYDTTGCVVFKKENSDLIRMVEEDYESITDDSLRLSIDHYLNNNVDTIVLGCTHYHFLLPRYERLFPDIKFITPSKAVVKRLSDIIRTEDIAIDSGETIFFTSGDDINLRNFLKGLGISNAEIVRFTE